MAHSICINDALVARKARQNSLLHEKVHYGSLGAHSGAYRGLFIGRTINLRFAHISSLFLLHDLYLGNVVSLGYTKLIEQH